MLVYAPGEAYPFPDFCPDAFCSHVPATGRSGESPRRSSTRSELSNNDLALGQEHNASMPTFPASSQGSVTLPAGASRVPTLRTGLGSARRGPARLASPSWAAVPGDRRFATASEGTGRCDGDTARCLLWGASGAGAREEDRSRCASECACFSRLFAEVSGVFVKHDCVAFPRADGS